MLKRFLLVAAVCCCFFANTLLASKKSIKVLVLPFEINSVEKREYLQNEIPLLIAKHLEQEGAIIVDLAESVQPNWREMVQRADGVRQMGLVSGADYIVWGSLTLVGQQFSLDAKMMRLFTKDRPAFFTAEGQGVENLPGRVKDLAVDIGLKLFARTKVTAVQVIGNQRIEDDAIVKVIQTTAGDIFSPKKLSDDLKAVYAMGYFDDVRVEAEDSPEGKVVIFRVEEKPTIRYLRIQNNSVYDDEEILDNLTIKTGSILNIFQIQSNIKLIEELYKEKNYHNVSIEYEVIEQKNNQADLEFKVSEGEKLRIEHIFFDGNEAFSDKELKKQIETKEKGFFYFLTESGELKKEKLDQDVGRLMAYYNNNGFIKARVGEPEIVYKEKWIELTFKVSEGPRFRVGDIDITGDLIFPKELLMKKVNIGKEEYYNRTILQNDILTLTDLYADDGYAYVDISPQIEEKKKDQIVDITYVINKGRQVYFEEIIITGNTKTRDKVIRRQLKVIEQELYSGTQLKESVRRLYRLDYFKDVKVDTVKGSGDDKMVLTIDVEEKSTGAFSFGGGYSNIENVFVVGSISQQNLFGRGQILNVSANVGGRSNLYSLNFTEPWLFDIPLSASIKLYNWIYDYDTYDKDSLGGGLSFGYPVFPNTRLTIGFAHDVAKIDLTDEENAPDSIIELVEQFGNSDIITNSITGSLRYDTRDKAFLPTEGFDHRLSLEYAGLGGDIAFTKTIGELGWYIPLVWKLVGFLHTKGGYVVENPNGYLPDYELFFLGGITSVRGWDRDDISPEDSEGNKIGADRFVQGNAELIFPIVADVGIHGVAFYDIGILANENAADPADRRLDIDNAAQSVGLGIRWNSPVGPIRVEYGWVIDPAPGQQPGDWEFALGAAF